MRPSPLIQLIAIFFGMSAIYSSISYLLSTGIITIQGLLLSRAYYGEGTSLYMLIIMAALSLLGFFIIAKSMDIASFITEKSGYTNNLQVKTENNELLCIFIVFLALGDLLKLIPYLLNDITTILLPNRHSDGIMDGFQAKERINWLLNFTQLLLPVLMIIFCRNLSQYFGKNVSMKGSFEISEHEQADIAPKEEN